MTGRTMRGNWRGLSATVALLAAGACSGTGDDPGDPGPNQQGEVQLKGAIQKGPFVIGSSVQVAMLDPKTANATGTVFNSTTRNDLGEFELTLTQLGAAEIITSGYYFNELSGALSKSSLPLRALAEFSAPGPQTVYVNAVTQMSYQRAKKLIASGTPFHEAIARAEGELRSALGLPIRSVAGAGTSMNLLGGDTDGNAYLFAVSCMLVQAAQNEAPSSAEAKLQELVSQIALDLEADGTLETSLAQVLVRARKNINPALCTENMKARLVATGVPVTVPEMSKALDFDGDGIVDADDPDADGDGSPARDDKASAVHYLQRASSGGGFAIDASGSLWHWNDEGAGTHSPPQRVENLPRIIKIVGKPMESGGTALAADGTVWRIWARQIERVGESSDAVDVSTDVILRSDKIVSSIHGSLDGVTAIADAGASLVALKEDGSVWVRTDRFSEVTGLPAGVTRIGYFWALTSAGQLWNWEPGTAASPRLVASGIRDVSPVGNCVAKTDGTVWEGTETGLRQLEGLSQIVAVSDGCRYGINEEGDVLYLRLGGMVRIPR